MKLECHKALGTFLLGQYLSNASPAAQQAFLLGCQFPDRNPTTYLKGSLRHNWLQGHHFDNSLKFMTTLCNRLEAKSSYSIYDYYSLGKLMHYVADAFTHCHNSNFFGSLSEHREYENRLNSIYSSKLKTQSTKSTIWKNSAIGTVLFHHKDYMLLPPSPLHDAAYSVGVCSALMKLLTGKLYVRIPQVSQK